MLCGTLLAQGADPAHYLDSLRGQMKVLWPDNRTVNWVFHGHSVPSGYFVTPVVNTLAAYPHRTLEGIKSLYPYAVVNAIVTAIGGENSKRGAERFEQDVLSLPADIIFIDYALNDRGIGLERARKAWCRMIEAALRKNIPVILLTPTPDQSVDLLDEDTDLARHAAQIRSLALHYGVGLVDSYAAFQREVRFGHPLSEYMSQINHPNERGHALVAAQIRPFYE